MTVSTLPGTNLDLGKQVSGLWSINDNDKSSNHQGKMKIRKKTTLG